MDTTSYSWISDLEMNSCDFGDHSLDSNGLSPADSYDNLGDLLSVPEGYNFQQTWSPESQTFSDQTDMFQRPKKQIKKADESSPAKPSGQKRSIAMVSKSPPEVLQDRVMAERKRREKLSQRFIALSSLIPGLKKMDKATVLGDAIGYLKHLQEHVKGLEEKLKAKPVVPVKTSRSSFSDDSSISSDEISNSCSKAVVRELEIKISETSVLVRIQCKKEKGIAAKLLDEVERLDLDVSNSIFFPFGQNSMDVTIFAQKKDECDMTVKELMRDLRSALDQKL